MKKVIAIVAVVAIALIALTSYTTKGNSKDGNEDRLLASVKTMKSGDPIIKAGGDKKLD